MTYETITVKAIGMKPDTKYFIMRGSNSQGQKVYLPLRTPSAWSYRQILSLFYNLPEEMPNTDNQATRAILNLAETEIGSRVIDSAEIIDKTTVITLANGKSIKAETAQAIRYALIDGADINLDANQWSGPSDDVTAAVSDVRFTDVKQLPDIAGLEKRTPSINKDYDEVLRNCTLAEFEDFCLSVENNRGIYTSSSNPIAIYEGKDIYYVVILPAEIDADHEIKIIEDMRTGKRPEPNRGAVGIAQQILDVCGYNVTSVHADGHTTAGLAPVIDGRPSKLINVDNIWLAVAKDNEIEALQTSQTYGLGFSALGSELRLRLF